jgi:hypothetical protein
MIDPKAAVLLAQAHPARGMSYMVAFIREPDDATDTAGSRTQELGMYIPHPNNEFF